MIALNMTPDLAENLPPETAVEDIRPEGIVRKGEYSRQGDFHKNLDPDWSYYPIYVNKIALVDELLREFGKVKAKTLDAGCGEGVLVEKYSADGWDMTGLDKNYSSSHVREGSMTAMPFSDAEFDNVLCLDVLEHLLYPDQNLALAELRRVMKPDGTLIVSIPNLAHFTARLKFLFRGRLLRTATIGHHPGDRPALEYEKLLTHYRFKIVKTYGIFPTVPPIYRFVMKNPSKSAGLLKFLRKLPFPVYWHFQVLFLCKPI